MRALTSALLLTLAFELSAAGGVCVLLMHRTHDCCSPTQEAPAPRSNPQPECCSVSLFVNHTVVSEVEGSRSHHDIALPLPVSPVQVPAIADTDGRLTLHPLSEAIPPPLSPLRQTCLLLI